MLTLNILLKITYTQVVIKQRKNTHARIASPATPDNYHYVTLF